jgi:hypothetical protein
MNYFSIGAIFKNESHILKEWLDHYFFHGVDHIYLINDNSTEKFLNILKPYINNKTVTLYTTPNNNCNGGLWPQAQYYNIYFQKHLKDSKWFGILDLDEFLYSPLDIDLKNILMKYENEEQLNINWVHFGSNGHINQPNLVVPNFTMRGEYNSKKNGPGGKYNSYKSIINCKFDNKPIQLGIHRHIKNNSKPDKNISFDLENTPMLINHYAIQSKEIWKKKTKSSNIGNHYPGFIRNEELFMQMDVNDIEDNRLNYQNEAIY